MVAPSGHHIQQVNEVQEVRPPWGTQQEVILASDSNIAQFEQTILHQVGDYPSMEVILNGGKTTEGVHHLINMFEEKAREVPCMYILHASVIDIL